MKIDLHRMTVAQVLAGYADSAEEGVTAYNGSLNIRPKYQREFVYRDKQRDDVIRTVKSGFPLNVMYWMVNDQGTYEVLDGQQRTISRWQVSAEARGGDWRVVRLGDVPVCEVIYAYRR